MLGEDEFVVGLEDEEGFGVLLKLVEAGGDIEERVGD